MFPLTTLITHYGIFIVAAIIIFGELGFPTIVPGEIALAIAGSHVIHTMPHLLLAVVGFGIVDIMATSTIHIVSRTAGHRLLIRVLGRLTPGSCQHEKVFECWRSRLGNRDAPAVFITRMIPMFRLYASITSGLVRVRFRSFLVGAAPASLVWACIPLTLGYLFRHSIHAMEGQYALIMHGVVAASIAASVVVAAALVMRRLVFSTDRPRMV